MSSELPTTQTVPKIIDARTIQPELSLSRPGVVSYIWNLGYGDVLIEVFDDGRICVNQQEVELNRFRKDGK